MPSPPVASPDRPIPADPILAWYDRAARDLPWRRVRDPYAIWVSEVMLQQTRVETVIPYYERFLERFPTLAALADAPEDAVLAAWSGLGYYRRARMLQAGAQRVVAEHGGTVPRDPTARRALPGVGPYTAGAIGSIAFELPEPIVDGNVARVLARYHGVATALGAGPTDRRLWALAAAAVEDARRPGAFNQGLMELGATVCRDTAPRCGDCPVARGCVARREGRQGELPVRRAKRPPRSVALVAVVPQTADGRVWLERSRGGMFGGLWGPPVANRGAGDGTSEVHALLSATGLTAAELVPGAPVRHVLTHRRFQVDTWAAYDARGRARDDLRPHAPEDLDGVGVSRFARKVLSSVPDAPSAPRQLRVLIDP